MRVFRPIKGDELLVGCLTLRDDGAVLYLGMLIEPGFDLTQFDAEATDLDLRVDSAQILNVAVLQPARQVTRLVHAGTRLEWIGDEFLLGQFRAIQISPRYARPAMYSSPATPIGTGC